MKKISIKILASALIILCAISTMSMCIPVKASSGIEPYTYETPGFSFKGTRYLSYDCTGMFLDVSVTATASNNNNETITLSVFVTNTGKTHTYTFLSDGQTHTYKNIYLGLKGGSSVRFGFTGANPEITIYANVKIVS
ncbi:MAG: hypothetical protein HFJ52_05165 [Clostridia bacterium]|nr:hypothetical protein [Clostridia bacterium]